MSIKESLGKYFSFCGVVSCFSFVLIIQKKLVDMGLEPRGVLLLDNCSAHPNESELVTKDGKVVAKILPPNVTSLIPWIKEFWCRSNAAIKGKFWKSWFSRMTKECIFLIF